MKPNVEKEWLTTLKSNFNWYPKSYSTDYNFQWIEISKYQFIFIWLDFFIEGLEAVGGLGYGLFFLLCTFALGYYYYSYLKKTLAVAPAPDLPWSI